VVPCWRYITKNTCHLCCDYPALKTPHFIQAQFFLHVLLPLLWLLCNELWIFLTAIREYYFWMTYGHLQHCSHAHLHTSNPDAHKEQALLNSIFISHNLAPLVTLILLKPVHTCWDVWLAHEDFVTIAGEYSTTPTYLYCSNCGSTTSTAPPALPAKLDITLFSVFCTNIIYLCTGNLSTSFSRLAFLSNLLPTPSLSGGFSLSH